MYVIKRISPKPGYVARPGSASSYTSDLAKARTFATKEQAKTELCPGNEIIVSVTDEMGGR